MDDIWRRTSSSFPPAGSVVPEDQRAKYLRFIKQLLKLKYPLSAPSVAVNAEYRLCRTDSLYDHSNDLFLAAFRLEKGRFLHPDVSQMDRWKRFGLRANDGGYRLPADYYLDCLRAMSARFEGYMEQGDINFLGDCGKVASLVCGYFSVSTDGSDAVWRAALKAPIFQVKRDVDGEPCYRKALMGNLASQQCTMSPENAGRIKDINISWSQVVFLKPEPVEEVYSVHPSKGSPSVQRVVAHLQYLIDIRTTVSQREVGPYLKDVQDTYAFLQAHIWEVEFDTTLMASRVWLNLETTDVDRIRKEDLGGALTSADRLCFRCPVDPGKLKFVRSFLTPFEKLLTALGCQSVKQPPLRAKRNPLDETARPMERVMGSICQLRKKEELFDITLSAMDKDNRKVLIKAHHVVLAASSDYFLKNSRWQDGKGAKDITLETISYETLSVVVDFMYNGETDPPAVTEFDDNDTIADSLDHYIDLLVAADYLQMARLHQVVEGFILDKCGVFIRPDNVKALTESAKDARAGELAAYCKDYEKQNQQIVNDCERLKADGT
jgi:sacsin